jgi:hypothetical protein
MPLLDKTISSTFAFLMTLGWLFIVGAEVFQKWRAPRGKTGAFTQDPREKKRPKKKKKNEQLRPTIKQPNGKNAGHERREKGETIAQAHRPAGARMSRDSPR